MDRARGNFKSIGINFAECQTWINRLAYHSYSSEATQLRLRLEQLEKPAAARRHFVLGLYIIYHLIFSSLPPTLYLGLLSLKNSKSRKVFTTLFMFSYVFVFLYIEFMIHEE